MPNYLMSCTASQRKFWISTYVQIFRLSHPTAKAFYHTKEKKILLFNILIFKKVCKSTITKMR